MNRGGTPYHFGDKGSSAGFECLQGSDYGKVCDLEERQCHSGGVHKENGEALFLVCDLEE